MFGPVLSVTAYACGPGCVTNLIEVPGPDDQADSVFLTFNVGIVPTLQKMNSVVLENVQLKAHAKLTAKHVEAPLTGSQARALHALEVRLALNLIKEEQEDIEDAERGGQTPPKEAHFGPEPTWPDLGDLSINSNLPTAASMSEFPGLCVPFDKATEAERLRDELACKWVDGNYNAVLAHYAVIGDTNPKLTDVEELREVNRRRKRDIDRRNVHKEHTRDNRSLCKSNH